MRCWTSWIGRARGASVALGDEHDERRRRHRDQPELGVDEDHRDAGEQQRQHRLQDEHEAVAEEEAHRLQVDGRARHQLAGLLVVEEAELEALQMGVDALAQVVFDRQRDAPGDHPPHVREHPAHEHDRDDHDREHEQRVAVVRAQRELVVASVAVAVLDRFDGRAGEVRDQHGHDHRQAGQHPRDGQPALVGPQEAEQAVEGVHSCLVNDYRRRWPAGVGGRAAIAGHLSLADDRAADPGAGSRRAARACATRARTSRRCATRAARVFSLCKRSRVDPAYPRYPRVPVLELPGLRAQGVLISYEAGTAGRVVAVRELTRRTYQTRRLNPLPPRRGVGLGRRALRRRRSRGCARARRRTPSRRARRRRRSQDAREGLR